MNYFELFWGQLINAGFVNKSFRYLLVAYYILLVWLSKHEMESHPLPIEIKLIAYTVIIMTQHIKPLNYSWGISIKGS